MSEYQIGHLEVDSPFGNAGGVLKSIEDVEKMAHTGVGWEEAGSYTLEKRLGNAVDPVHPEAGPQYTVYHYDPVTGKTANSLGMPGKGMDVVETEIPIMADVAHGFGKPLLVNVAPVSDDPAAESKELVTRAYEAGADAVILNAGCPNVIVDGSERHELLSHNVDALRTTLNGLREVTERYSRIFIRPSPLKTIESVGSRKAFQIYQVIHQSGVVSAAFISNTWPEPIPRDENGESVLEIPGDVAGISGPAMAPKAAEEVAWAVGSLRGTGIDIVASSSIVSGDALAGYVNESQVAGGAGTTFFRESGDWEHDVDKLLWEFKDSTQ